MIKLAPVLLWAFLWTESSGLLFVHWMAKQWMLSAFAKSDSIMDANLRAVITLQRRWSNSLLSHQLKGVHHVLVLIILSADKCSIMSAYLECYAIGDAYRPESRHVCKSHSLLLTEVTRGSNNAYATPITTNTAFRPWHEDTVLSLNLLQGDRTRPLNGKTVRLKELSRIEASFTFHFAV